MKKIILSAVLSAAAAAFADTTWTGSGDDNLWSTAGNWSGIVPVNGNSVSGVLKFPNGLDATKCAVTMDGAASFTSTDILRFDAGTSAVPLVFKAAQGTDGFSYTGEKNSYIAHDGSTSAYVVLDGGTYDFKNEVYLGQNDDAEGWLVLTNGAYATSGQVVPGKYGVGHIIVERGSFFYSTADLTLGRDTRTDAGRAKYSTAEIRGGGISSTKLWLPYNEQSGARAKMLITDGGVYTNRTGDCVIARKNAYGEVVVDGEGSEFKASAVIRLAEGEASTGVMTVRNGGVVNTVNSNPSWRIGNGASSTATLTVQDGGIVNAENYTCLGVGNGSTASLVVDGGTFRQIRDALIINQTVAGNSLTATCTVQNGGRIEAAKIWIVENSTSGTGALTIEGDSSEVVVTGEFQMSKGSNAGPSTLNLSGGVLEVPAVLSGKATNATINFNGGTLKAHGDSTAFLPANATVNIGAAGAIIDTNGKNVTIPAGCFKLADGVAAGTIVKTGGGTLTLTGALASGITVKVEGGALADNADVRAMPVEVGANGAIVFSAIGEIAATAKDVAEYQNLTIASGAKYCLLGKGATATVDGAAATTNAVLEIDNAGKVTARLPAEGEAQVVFYDGAWSDGSDGLGYRVFRDYSNTAAPDLTAVFLSDVNLHTNDKMTCGEVILKGVALELWRSSSWPSLTTKHIGGEGVIELQSFGIMSISGADTTIDAGITIRTGDHGSSQQYCFINKNGSNAITVNGPVEVNDVKGGSLRIETSVTFNGNISGDGVLDFRNQNLTTTFNGDNSAFTGTVDKTEGEKHTIVLSRPEAASAHAAWIVKGDMEYTGQSGATLKFGTFSAERNEWGCFYYPDNAEIAVEVGARGDDFATTPSKSQGSYHFRAKSNSKSGSVALKKVGAGTFTSDLYGYSTLQVTEGAYVFAKPDMKYANTEQTIFSVTVSDGASIGGVNGTQTIGTLSLESGAGIRGVLAEAVEGESVPTAVTGQITLASGATAVSLASHPVTFSEADAARLAEVATGERKKTIADVFNLGNAFTGAPTEETGITAEANEKGKANNWLVKTANSIVSLLLEGTASGLMIIIR